MQKIEAQDPLAHSADLVAANIEQLKTLFPELITEGPNGTAVNVDILKSLVGDKTVTDADEKYGLNWHGKRRARQLALTPSAGTLRPCPEDSVNWDTTKNIFIEGDNLEVLKLLQKSYAGKVKLIYIDPPYNTGKDFVYPDNFQDNIRNYMELTGQIEGDRKISSNTESSGRYHTDWLNMMYPRLKLARNLLREDGVLLISIDDIEFPAVRKLVDEVFGEENRLSDLVWDLGSGTAAGHFTRSHEYIVAFAKSKINLPNFKYSGDRDTISERAVKRISRGNPASIIDFPAGIEFEGADRIFPSSFGNSEKIRVVSGVMECKNGRLANPVSLEAGWAMRNQILSWLENKETFDTKGQKVLRFYFSDKGVLQYEKERGFVNPPSVLRQVASTKKGSDEVTAVFGKKVMDFPKPIALIRSIVDLVCDKNEMICDFFAGSCTTALAALCINMERYANLRFICVQIPEPCDPSTDTGKNAIELSLNTIADIGKNRIRYVIEQMQIEQKLNAEKGKQEFLDFNPDVDVDFGFRVFKLDSSNIRMWEPDRDNLEQTLYDHAEHLKPDRTEADILYELLLKLGLDLCVPMEKLEVRSEELEGNRHTVYAIGGGVLMACLSEKIGREDVEPLAQGILEWHKELAPAGDTTCVFRDSAFADDVAKTNLAAILDQHGIKNVRSL